MNEVGGWRGLEVGMDVTWKGMEWEEGEEWKFASGGVEVEMLCVV